ncbi:MAG TPA: hypothetical protein VGG28_07105 [Kofleriaceae bacterium]
MAKQGFRFDAHRAALVKAALAALKGRPLPAPITQLKLTGQPEMIRLDGLVIEGRGDAIELRLSLPADKIPGHSDDSGGDEVLARFHAAHGTHEPTWGDTNGLPWCVLIHEQLAAAHEIVDALKQQGVKLAKTCKVGVGAYDSFWQDDDKLARMSLASVAAMPRARRADFAVLCFESPDRQRWLLGE